MSDRPPRLGDVVDDYCSRCKLLMDHAVQALDGTTIRTVVCKTCMHSHPFRHGKGGRKKTKKPSLFEQILAKRPPMPFTASPTTKKTPNGDGEDQ